MGGTSTTTTTRPVTRANLSRKPKVPNPWKREYDTETGSNCYYQLDSKKRRTKTRSDIPNDFFKYTNLVDVMGNGYVTQTKKTKNVEDRLTYLSNVFSFDVPTKNALEAYIHRVV